LRIICLFISALFIFQANGQAFQVSEIQWKLLRTGLQMARIPFPFKIFSDDSVVTLLKLNKDGFDCQLLCASSRGKVDYDAREWAEKEGFDLVFNAGMYLPENPFTARSFMKAGKHINQPKFDTEAGGAFCISENGTFSIEDFTCKPFDSLKNSSHSLFQAMRMLDCAGRAISWEKRKQKCSMLVLAEDKDDNLIMAFCKSPMLHAEMVNFLVNLRLGLHSALYMEGGPEASVHIRLADREINLIGTYVSKTWEKLDNKTFRKLPNVLGIRFLKD